jgi:hypothetical protein
MAAGVAAVLVTAVVQAAPASAQFSVQDRLASQQDALRVADDFGACVVSQYTATARRIVTEPVEHSRLFEDFRAEISGRCVNESDVSGPPSQMWFPYPTVHAVLADNLIKREFRRTGPADLSAAPAVQPIPAPVLPDVLAMADMTERQRAALVAQHASDDAWQVLQRIGMCTARRAPESVRAVALTRIGSDEERTALRTLTPEIGACVPTGATVRLRPPELRWAAALGYYRLAAAMNTGADRAQGSE